jgi:hypothetical protein
MAGVCLGDVLPQHGRQRRGSESALGGDECQGWVSEWGVLSSGLDKAAKDHDLAKRLWDWTDEVLAEYYD